MITSNLIRQKPNWINLPTKAIRVPEIFCDRLLEIARELDGSNEFEGQRLDNASIQERSPEKSILESAILYLASYCDGAAKEDGQGFNKFDTRFGKYLASQIEANQLTARIHSRDSALTKAQAETGLKMLQKYHHQLDKASLVLPLWDEIANQYKNAVECTIEEASEYKVVMRTDKIAVFAPYDPSGEFQRLAKSIKGYKFNGDDKGWYYSKSQAPEIAQTFPETSYDWDTGFRGQIELAVWQAQEAEAALKIKAEEKSQEIIRLIEAAYLDEPLVNGWYLREYQKEGIKWLLSHHKKALLKGGILADDMGLGKTLTALVAAKAMQKIYGCCVFVIAPVSLKENWLIEAKKVGMGIEVFSNAYQKIPSAVSKPYLVITDEAHYFQNEKSKRTQTLLGLIRNQNCIGNWLLTGTPIKNGRPINLVPLLQAIAHPIIENKWDYFKRYCNAKQTSFGWDFTGAAHLDELSKKIEDGMLRRTKKECLKELPPKTRLYAPVELESKQRKAYSNILNDLIADYKRRVREGEVDPAAEALVTLNYLRKTGSQFKVEAAVEWAQKLLEQGQQVVLFTEFRESAEMLHQRLGGELLTGETKATDRQEAVNRFQSEESKVFVGTIKAGGVGITLTSASDLLLVDRPWTPGDAEQAEDRIYRLGQENAAFATWLQLGEIDSAVDQLLQSKQKRIDLVLAGKRKTLRGTGSVKQLAQELLELLDLGR
jgi:hypothetical protein